MKNQSQYWGELLDIIMYSAQHNLKEIEPENVNIHELTYLAKEWAKSHGYSILSGVENLHTYCARAYYTDFLTPDVEFIKSSEAEAVFALCEWIRKELQKRGEDDG
jgi:hypothetical protein